MMRNIFSSRWYALALALSASFFVLGACRLCLPVLFKEIAAELNFDLVTVGTIWGIDPLAAVFMSLPGGLIVDRFGVKKTFLGICFLGAVFGALRGLSIDFATMAITTFLLGAIGSTVAVGTAKLTAVYFQGHLKLTNALSLAAMYTGQMAGSMLSASIFSPLLGGWRNVLFVYSLPILLTGILWLLVGGRISKDATPVTSPSSVNLGRSLLRVMRIRTVWIVSIHLFSLLGLILAVNGYLPLYLRGIGWDAVGSGSALTLMLGMAFAGTLPVTFLPAHLLPSKPTVVVTVILMCICIALIPVFNGPAVLVMAALAGFFRAFPSVLLNVIILESREVGQEYAGTAIGFTYTVGMLGAFAFPPLGNSLASINPGLPFFFWAALCLLSLTGFLFLKNERPPASKTDG
jgi:MFS family permease